jgi:hypothetical protein
VILTPFLFPLQVRAACGRVGGVSALVGSAVMERLAPALEKLEGLIAGALPESLQPHMASMNQMGKDKLGVDHAAALAVMVISTLLLLIFITWALAGRCCRLETQCARMST